MDKQTIEEMTKLMENWAVRNGMLWHEGHAKALAEILLEEYQPKIPEGAVVLTKEEYINNLTKYYGVSEIKDMVRKETAEKFAEMAREGAFTDFMGEPIIRASKIDEICKELTESE